MLARIPVRSFYVPQLFLFWIFLYLSLSLSLSLSFSLSLLSWVGLRKLTRLHMQSSICSPTSPRWSME
jgi:hypothetical protein